MTDREAMQQALEALEMLAKWEHPASNITTKTGRIYPQRIAADAADAIRTAIAEAEKHEPVAQIIALGQYEFPGLEWLSADHSFRAPIGTLLYTTPPAAQRQWVGLTDEDFENAFQETYIMGDSDLQDFAKVIEAKLKEKNT